ncbi:MAG: hypothetical protein M3499_00725 [Actinomycetota bacterium]|nr:hypothetical protein [Actinomycetota bacterium]
MTENSADPSTPQTRRSGSRRPASADQERLVRRYLSALETSKPGRGVKRAADAVGNRITKIDELLVSADPLTRVHLTQERIELHAEYVRITNGNHPDVSQLERDFVRVVRSYGDRHGITYAAWRQVGVEATVLEQAGIHKAEKKPPPAAVRAAADRAAASENGSAAKAKAEVTTPVAKAEVTTPAPGPPVEVSLDELADLLAEAGSARPAPPEEASDQPSLDDLEATSTYAAPDPSRRASGA